jgi:hypothetical protein
MFDRTHVALNAVHHDRVAIAKVVAGADKIEAAIRKPVGTLFVSALYQAHCRWLSATRLQEVLTRRRPGRQAVEVAGAASFDVVVPLRPHLVEKGPHRHGLKQPG